MQSLLAVEYPAVGRVPQPVAGYLTGGSFDNLLSNRVGLVLRMSGAYGQYDIYYDLGRAVPVDTIAMLWTNFNAPTDFFWATPMTDNWGGDLPGGFGTASTSGWNNQLYNRQLVTSAGCKGVITLSTPTTARYWRLSYVQYLSPKPVHVEISRVFFGKRLNFSVDYSSIELIDDDRSLTDQTDYGEDIEDVRRISFGWRPRFRFGSEAELVAMHQLLVMQGKAKPVLFLPAVGVGKTNEEDFIAFGKLRSPAKTMSQAYDIWELSFDVFSEAA